VPTPFDRLAGSGEGGCDVHEAEKTAPSDNGGTTDETDRSESDAACAREVAPGDIPAQTSPEVVQQDAQLAGAAATEAAQEHVATAEYVDSAVDTAADAGSASPDELPATTAEPTAVALPNGPLSWWPFALQLLVWVAFAGASAYLLGGATSELPARWLPAYGPLLWVGVALTVMGPLLALVVWLVARVRREPEGRCGLFTTSLVRSATVTLLGVMIWITLLCMIELHAGGGLL